MILVIDNDWSNCKNLHGFLSYKVSFFMFMGGHIEHWTRSFFFFKRVIYSCGVEMLLQVKAITNIKESMYRFENTFFPQLDST
jgi:hypothetical protein